MDWYRHQGSGDWVQMQGRWKLGVARANPMEMTKRRWGAGGGTREVRIMMRNGGLVSIAVVVVVIGSTSI